MKIIVTVSPSQRANVTAARTSLERMLDQLKQAESQQDDVRTLVGEAERKHAEYSAKADRDETAASKMLAAATQVQLLRPKLQRLENSTAHALQVAANLVGHVRQEVIAGQFGSQMRDALWDEIGRLVRPFYSSAGFARQAAAGCDSNGIISRFLQRRAPGVSDVDSARAEVANTIAELDAILKGEPLLDVTAPQRS